MLWYIRLMNKKEAVSICLNTMQIVFDECHKAKNLCPTGSSKPTKTGQTVLELQNRLPKARIVYASATGIYSVDKVISSVNTLSCLRIVIVCITDEIRIVTSIKYVENYI